MDHETTKQPKPERSEAFGCFSLSHVTQFAGIHLIPVILLSVYKYSLPLNNREIDQEKKIKLLLVES